MHAGGQATHLARICRPWRRADGDVGKGKRIGREGMVRAWGGWTGHG
jgi:hypothetical protein